MIKKQLRLKKSRIEYILSKGKRLNLDNNFTAKYLPSKNNESHFCVVVSLKTAPKAVLRNLLRRRVYEIIRLNQNLLKDPHDFIIISKKTISRQFRNLEKSIIQLFKSIIKINK